MKKENKKNSPPLGRRGVVGMTAEEGKQKTKTLLLREGGELVTRHNRMGFPQEMGTQYDITF